MNLNDSVILPRDDFMELSTAAWQQVPATAKERLATCAQTTFVFAALAGGTVVTVWGCVKAMDWLEEKRHQRGIRKYETTGTYGSM